MTPFNLELQIRWSDLDPNFHLRHSVYYDWGAMARVSFLNQYGLTAAVMQQLNFGPILFREESIFRREIRLGDVVRINVQLLSWREDYSRWTIQHQIIKEEDTLCAVLTVDGAWMDLSKRKLTAPPEIVKSVFEKMERAAKNEE